MIITIEKKKYVHLSFIFMKKLHTFLVKFKTDFNSTHEEIGIRKQRR